MRNFIFLCCLAICTWCHAQEDQAATRAAVRSEGRMREGSYATRERAYHAISVTLKSDFNAFIEQLEKDLNKRSVAELDNVTNKIILFPRFKREDWSEMKLSLTVMAISNGSKSILTITCIDSKGNDFLAPKSDSKAKVWAYFQELITEE